MWHMPRKCNQLSVECGTLMDSQWTRTVLGRRAFRVCGPATWNTLPTELRTTTVCLDKLTLSAKNWKLVCSRAVTESALDDIDCLFCAIQIHVLIEWFDCRRNTTKKLLPEITSLHNIQSESKNPPPRFFLTFFPKWSGIFSPNFIHILYVPIYAGLQILIQLPATWMRLCHIKRDHHYRICSKCPPSTETHAAWSHLIWHNFTVGGNWLKICSLAYIGTYNRWVKFGPKIPNWLGKMSQNASVRFGR